jgi:primosomal protein N' (replication factor Y)
MREANSRIALPPPASVSFVLIFPTLLQWRMPADQSPAPSAAGPRYAQVLIPRHITKSFTYLIPPELARQVSEGQRVLVPFGRTTVEGAVLSVAHHPPSDVLPGRLKEIRCVADHPADSQAASVLFALARRVSDEYVAPWGQSLRLITPRPDRTASASLRYVATEEGRTALEEGRCPELLRPVLARIARRTAGLSSRTLLARRPSQAGLLEKLSANGWISRLGLLHEQQGTRPAATVAPEQPSPSLRPDEDFRPPDPDWSARLTDALTGGPPGTLLVHASWRDRLGLLVQALHEMVRRRRSAMILCGEVAKAQWLGRLLRTSAHLPVHILSLDDEAAVLERPSAAPEAPALLVGTRSAVFAPLPKVGLIWVEEEDDPALKEPQEPRYHGRDVARMRAELEGALLILASSHPSVESYSTLHKEHRLARQGADGPGIELVDLRVEQPGTVFSAPLATAIDKALTARAGILLFLNRKGYAGALACRDCGWVPRCPACAVACSYSRSTARLTCRYCGYGVPLPDLCGKCRAARLNPVGEGTERVELEARRLFPRADIVRLDGDTTRRPREAERLWSRLYRGDVDMVIGTQLVFQRAPLPPMGLVGIILADTALHVPDFRAAERTYQHLMAAAETARPAREGGRLYLQTRLPDHHAIQAVVQGAPDRFYDEELAARELLGYPPACALASLAVSGRQPDVVQRAAAQWRGVLEQGTGGSKLTILGPFPSLGSRARGHHRHTMLVKSTDRAALQAALRRSAEELEGRYRRSQAKFIVDMDPVETL